MYRKICVALLPLLITIWFQPVLAEEQSAEYQSKKKRPVKSTEATKQQQEETVLEDLVVTATSEVKMLNTPASISVITAQDLEDQGVKNVAEALVRVPGVYDDGSANSALSLRGTRSSTSGGPLALIDGVPQDPGMYGYNYWETIPVSEIERIEVLRSPGSTAFGADSARGVISIITKRAKKNQPLSVKAKASVGSWGTYDEYATLSGGLNQWDLLLNGSRTDTRGYVHDTQRRAAGRLAAGYNFSDRARLGIDVGYKDNYWVTVRGKDQYALDQDRRADEFKQSPTAKETTYNETDQKVASATMNFSYKSSGFFLNSLAAASSLDENYNARYNKYISPKSVYKDDRDQDRYVMDVSAGYNFAAGFFQYTPKLGGNLETTSLTQRRNYYNDPSGKESSKKKAEINYDQDKYGIFFQNQFLFGNNWELNAGVRWDYVTYDVKNKNGDSVDTDDSNFSWSVAPAYHWNENATTYVSVGKSYWYPVAYYYQAAMEYMNPENLPENLKPESSLVYEIGHKQHFSKMLNVNLTLFWMNYKDKYAVFYDRDQAYAGYKNIGDSEQKGVELEADGRLCSWFGYRLAGTYMDAKWTSGRERVYTWETPTSQDFRDLDGYELNRLPKYKYLVEFDFYPLENLKIHALMNGTGSYWVDYLNRIKYGGKVTFDTGIRYDLADWSFWLLGKNIFDTKIESVYNSNGQLNTGEEEIALNGPYANDYYPRLGRYLELGVTYQF